MEHSQRPLTVPGRTLTGLLCACRFRSAATALRFADCLVLLEARSAAVLVGSFLAFVRRHAVWLDGLRPPIPWLRRLGCRVPKSSLLPADGSGCSTWNTLNSTLGSDGPLTRQFAAPKRARGGPCLAGPLTPQVSGPSIQPGEKAANRDWERVGLGCSPHPVGTQVLHDEPGTGQTKEPITESPSTSRGTPRISREKGVLRVPGSRRPANQRSGHKAAAYRLTRTRSHHVIALIRPSARRVTNPRGSCEPRLDATSPGRSATLQPLNTHPSKQDPAPWKSDEAPPAPAPLDLESVAADRTRQARTTNP
ncbi:hypothetical protein ENSA7_08850 [Enhygromyxa salina]|uniref:Uncharacterized protein n=1 Tax=Enhygromyxa salina TaxID=215803 RepID=A0A2S9YWD5_9BACT|nr:hypothetical protein ENSA7_08850 [Enhygromyxa salina]